MPSWSCLVFELALSASASASVASPCLLLSLGLRVSSSQTPVVSGSSPPWLMSVTSRHIGNTIFTIITHCMMADQLISRQRFGKGGRRGRD